MMLYRVLSSNVNEKLAEEVETLLNDGWRLHGDAFATPTSNSYQLHQALTKSEDGAYAEFKPLTALYPNLKPGPRVF